MKLPASRTFKKIVIWFLRKRRTFSIEQIKLGFQESVESLFFKFSFCILFCQIVKVTQVKPGSLQYKALLVLTVAVHDLGDAIQMSYTWGRFTHLLTCSLIASTFSSSAFSSSYFRNRESSGLFFILSHFLEIFV